MIGPEELIKDMEYCMAQWECFRCPKAFKDGKSVCNESKKGVVFIPALFVKNAIELLKEQKNEYEKGFNDAMQGKQELMYEGTDGKWHKKDW